MSYVYASDNLQYDGECWGYFFIWDRTCNVFINKLPLPQQLKLVVLVHLLPITLDGNAVNPLTGIQDVRNNVLFYLKEPQVMLKSSILI